VVDRPEARRLAPRDRDAPADHPIPAACGRVPPLICGAIHLRGHEIDFRVIGTPVLLECDGWAFHGLQRETFERDRRRDAEPVAEGWIVVRFTYWAVTTTPGATADRIDAAVARWSS
jgi:hypothetical protein